MGFFPANTSVSALACIGFFLAVPNCRFNANVWWQSCIYQRCSDEKTNKQTNRNTHLPVQVPSTSVKSFCFTVLRRLGPKYRGCSKISCSKEICLNKKYVHCVKRVLCYETYSTNRKLITVFLNNMRRYCRQLRLPKLQRRYHSICKHANYSVINVIYFIWIRIIKYLHDKTCLPLALVCQIIQGFFVL